MAGTIIWCLVVFGCAILFLSIGIYANNREKPMWFWSGTVVDASTISDVKAYNKENAKMWIFFSLWFFAAGIVHFFSKGLSIALLLASCFIGIPILVITFTKIEKKYTIKK